MAGRRRARAEGNELGPTQRAARAERRRQNLAARWATSTSSMQRAELAFDYWRGACTRRNPDQGLVDRMAEEVARLLVERGDQVLGLQGSEPLRPEGRHAA